MNARRRDANPSRLVAGPETVGVETPSTCLAFREIVEDQSGFVGDLPGMPGTVAARRGPVGAPVHIKPRSDTLSSGHRDPSQTGSPTKMKCAGKWLNGWYILQA